MMWILTKDGGDSNDRILTGYTVRLRNAVLDLTEVALLDKPSTRRVAL